VFTYRVRDYHQQHFSTDRRALQVVDRACTSVNFKVPTQLGSWETLKRKSKNVIALLFMTWSMFNLRSPIEALVLSFRDLLI
jgi:hypothetical protein